MNKSNSHLTEEQEATVHNIAHEIFTNCLQSTPISVSEGHNSSIESVSYSNDNHF